MGTFPGVVNHQEEFYFLEYREEKRRRIDSEDSELLRVMKEQQT